MSSLDFRVAVLALALPAIGHFGPASAAAQDTTPAAGLRDNTPAVHALVGGRIIVGPGRTIDKGTLVIRRGLIEAVGPDVQPPADARVWVVEGRTLYPGFIDAYSEIDVPVAGGGDRAGPGYWNRNVQAQARAAEAYAPDRGFNKKLRGQGVAVRLIAPAGGIVRGTSALVTTGDDEGSQSIVRAPVALHLRLQPRGGGREEYPGSPMGAMALVRQALLDADWYTRTWQAYQAQPGLKRPKRSDVLDALQNALDEGLPLLIDAPDEWYFLRADGIGREFSRPVIVRGSGREYRRLDALATTGRPVIVPLAFPDPPAVDSPEAARAALLDDLLHWDIAPENPARLAAAGVRMAFTGEGLKDRDQYLEGVRTAIARGLPMDAALAALTVAPAELFGVADRIGTLEAGKAAHIVVADGDLFAKGNKVIETWVDGRRYEQATAPRLDLRGKWELTITAPDGATRRLTLVLEGDQSRPGGKLTQEAPPADPAAGEPAAGAAADGTQSVPATAEAPLTSAAADDARLVCVFKGDPLGWNGVVRLSGAVTADPAGGDVLLGSIVWPDGGTSQASGKRIVAAPAAADTKLEEIKAASDPAAQKPPRRALFPVNYPLGANGLAAIPPQPAAVLFRNATVWTSGPQGRLENASVLVQAGKITAVGTDIAAPEGTIAIDCAGRHLTPGIIDCHSHIATDGGVNESTQSVTAEVRIGDFVNANDVNIYRQLAGGVTAVNILHGSANTIGGQTQVIKLRWGALPEEMKLATAWPGIKFALGENVKQSNWGDNFNSRYPQTRMGVEQLVLDAFRATQSYTRTWDRWRTNPLGLPPRRDLELDALAEVLAGTRKIHCHSYRQDEILAFLRTCDAFGVRVATLQHVLEGYKLADVMAAQGVGGSTFSDWWAYKFEVYDAIPYNAALMHDAGVVVSLNSDFPELARRLNVEAAKAVKYGGVAPEEALKFVTLNPARQIGVDGITGSIEIGKDADLALWNGSPLSSLARCEQTWVDGRKYFDRNEDLQRRAEATKMRAALVQRILNPDAG